VVVSAINQPHIESLRVLGATPARILCVHLAPQALGAVLVYASADAGVLALAIATLSFLGLGVQPPTPEWGQMLVDGLSYLEISPRQVILPGLALTAMVASFNILGEALALDKTPRPLSRWTLSRRRRLAAMQSIGE
jgi:peptide/nickel transport system permease protein